MCADTSMSAVVIIDVCRRQGCSADTSMCAGGEAAAVILYVCRRQGCSADTSMCAGDKALIKSWMTVLILPYMCPDTCIYVSSYRRQRSDKVMDD